MKRRGWMKFGLLAGAGALLMGGLAFAKGGRGGHCGWGRGGMSPEDRKRFAAAKIDEVLDELRVTEEQRASIHATRDRLFAALEEARPDREVRFEELKALFQEDDLDLREVEALKAAHRDRMRKLEEAVSQAFVEVHATLTPEQRKQLVSKAERFQGRFGRD